ncbi:MAG: DUF1294 domain-containing protein [Ruminococcaceae bacterium]|nr:DUF1294 domain-containing protein [Oscillospiraceae bacterium]
MNNIFSLLVIYIFVISLLSVILTVKDKISAIRHRRRISEKTLFFFSAIGGGLAMYLIMLSIGHKTRHKRFMIGIPLIVVAQAVLCVVIYYMVK